MSIDLTAALRDVAAHLDKHPELVDPTISVRVENTGLDVLAWGYGGPLRELVAWIRTLHAANLVEVHEAMGRVQLHVVGELVEGLPIKVAGVLTATEVELLGARTRLVDGATFPVQLLLEVAAAEAPAAEGAEAVSR